MRTKHATLLPLQGYKHTLGSAYVIDLKAKEGQSAARARVRRPTSARGQAAIRERLLSPSRLGATKHLVLFPTAHGDCTTLRCLSAGDAKNAAEMRISVVNPINLACVDRSAAVILRKHGHYARRQWLKKWAMLSFISPFFVHDLSTSRSWHSCLPMTTAVD